MKILATLAAGALAIFAAACGSDSDGTPEGATTTTPTGTATAAPTGTAEASSTPAPPGAGDETASFIAVIDLASGDQTTLFDGAGNWNTWFEANGEWINALVLGEATRPRAVSLAFDGSVIADSSTELQVRTSADGSARAYAGETENPGLFQTFLEVDGEIVELDGDSTALPLSFSPGGDRLLSYVGVATDEGTVAFQYVVHNLDGSVASSFISEPPPGVGLSPTTWSPSGEYLASLGVDGLTIRGIDTGGEFLLPVNGWTEWSPTEDALIVVAGANELQILRMPDLDVTSIEVDTNGIYASFDPSGQVVTATNILTSSTTVFDATTGEPIAEFGGLAEGVPTIGFEPVQMTDDGLAALIEQAPGCDGVLVIHPLLGQRGECLTGRNPRWSPDASRVAFTRADEVLIFEVETASERVLASGVPAEAAGTLARWNEGGTHLLLESPWGGAGWTDTLP